MDTSSSIFFIQPLSPDIWRQYRAFADFYNLVETAVPKRGIFVCLEDGRLAAGVCVFETEGEWVLFEHLVTNPKLERPVRYAAIRCALEAARVYAAVVGKHATSMVTHPSVGEALAAAGVPKKDTVVFQEYPVSSSPVSFWLPEVVAEAHPESRDSIPVDTNQATGVQPAVGSKRSNGKKRLDALFGDET